MSFWWKHHEFSAFSDADKRRVEDLTGCIPLLLKPFVMHHEKTLESLEPQIWEDLVLESVRRRFCKGQKTRVATSYGVCPFRVFLLQSFIITLCI